VNLLAGSFQIQFGSEPGKGAASQSANIGSSHEVGIELGIRGKAASGWRWNASYSFASITDDIVPGLINPGLDYRHGTPQHTVILGGGYSLDRWELDAQGRWQSNFQDFRANAAADAFQAIQVDNYVSFSARIGFRVTDFLTLSGTAEQFDVLGLSASGGPLIERRFIAAATAHF
jgi:outer membrane receptor protein involved in Fe transport